MCGIAGYAGTGTAQARERVERAVAALRHRGPDDAGAWTGEGACLGFARLSIIDLSPAGHQPMLSGDGAGGADGRYVIVFNGEIYNFPELRRELEAQGVALRGHSDTEVLLEIFARVGLEACLAKLRGMFAFAVWDRREQTLSLARDLHARILLIVFDGNQRATHADTCHRLLTEFKPTRSS